MMISVSDMLIELTKEKMEALFLRFLGLVRILQRLTKAYGTVL